MNKRQRKFAEAQLSGTCTNPIIGNRLSVYISNPLDEMEAEAEEVEDHLLECRHCREFFLMMLDLRNEASKAQNKIGDGHASFDAEATCLADFRKE